MGLLILESSTAVEGTREGDRLEVDADGGIIRNVSTGESFEVRPVPPFMKELLQDGGLIEHIKTRREESRTGQPCK